VVGLASVLGGAPQARADGNQPEVYFSPHGGCTEAVVREIAAARSTVNVQAYSFTSAPIAQALADAEARGVQVEVILDKSNRTARYSGADYLIHHGIPTRIDAAHAIAHNKVMIIDGQVVLTGSFNFTKAAECVFRGMPITDSDASRSPVPGCRSPIPGRSISPE
jgi:phosphatidylserine/phosphatidylglycerophosphate/cardiolipin synthase-like enzyme